MRTRDHQRSLSRPYFSKSAAKQPWALLWVLIVTPAVSALIALRSDPHDILLTFVGTCES
jgi:hypothetical protein